MSLKGMRAELKRLSAQVGVGEEPVLLIVLATAQSDPENMDYPDSAGHYLSYPILGQMQSFHFPFSVWTSEQAEEAAMQVILHTIRTESLRRREPALLDMRFFNDPGAWIVSPPPPGVSAADHAAEQYRLICEARNENA